MNNQGLLIRQALTLTKLIMQQEILFKKKNNIFPDLDEEQLLEDLFKAYFDARRNKRNTINALKFELNLEENIFSLFEDIISGKYVLKPSICFVVNKPVKREIFAADFRDRVVHHLVYNYISPIFERKMINDTYSCRKGKGVHYGIKRAEHFIRSCSSNYHKNCYILKIDIKSYFMSMNKELLFNLTIFEIEKERKKQGKNLNFSFLLIKELLRIIIFADPTNRCIIKGKKNDWDDLPKGKSLFFSKKGYGLPIGNLTSQLFGNVYLNKLDHFIKNELRIKYYGRYVDDILIVNENRDHLKKVIFKIKEYLFHQCFLILHPKKIYLQEFSKGAIYLGLIIKPYRKYLSKRVKNNFYSAVFDSKVNEKIKETVNSYLGIMSHCNSYNLKERHSISFREAILKLHRCAL
jgi:hypothetical protein